MEPDKLDDREPAALVSVLSRRSAWMVVCRLVLPFLALVGSSQPGIASPATVPLRTVLESSRATWEDPSYGLFRWDRFPSILVVDTANFAFQDRMFSRIAFFLEKRGFRGRLLSDAELAGRHGWNAHDYGAQELADFFGAASLTRFPLDSQELLLRDIALQQGILVMKRDRFAAGVGGIISVSRGSSAIERRLLLTHESFHGIFFASRAYRDYCFRLWDSVTPAERGFVTSFLDDLGYDGESRYLAVNEFQAYLMQQPAAFAPAYFERVLARFGSRAASDRVLLAGLLSAARALDSYLQSHFGIRAGGTLLPSQPAAPAG
ncbi:MAG TPA: hypothetical protein VMG58_14225 [Candidatus Sulfotelmatobacter sp.]|nr:hypothetical protein [Candidatus Sulfotelmatobacter sp.]